MKKKAKLPLRQAVLVSEVRFMAQALNVRSSSHTEVYCSARIDPFYLTYDSTVPSIGELVVLQQTVQRPVWWSRDISKPGLYLWEVVRDE